MRGRVIARDGEVLRVRTSDGDVEHSPAGDARPGDLVRIDGEQVTVVRAGSGTDYPSPSTEVARMSARRVDNLWRRSRVNAAIRRFFADRGFLEIDAPLLVPAPGLEVHIAAVPAHADHYLITSPELQMKRLLAAGLERIYALCKCFRAEESGPQHSCEFTMLEWYRAWDDLDAIREDTEQLVAAAAEAATGDKLARVGGMQIDLTPPFERVTVRQLFAELIGIVLFGDEPQAEFRHRLVTAGVDVGDAREWDDLFYAAFLHRIEPALRQKNRPVFVEDWPVRLGALARRKSDDPSLVERFELYVGGVELANAFGELTDADEQVARLRADQRARERRGLPVYPIDERFVASLREGLPPCAGIALGVDRLTMLVTGAESIRDVLAFAGDEL